MKKYYKKRYFRKIIKPAKYICILGFRRILLVPNDPDYFRQQAIRHLQNKKKQGHKK